MERLSDAQELLDGPLEDPGAIDGNLRDLARINHWLGGTSLSRGALEAVPGTGSRLTVLDVGTGGADIPVALLRWAERRGTSMTVVGIDSRQEIIAAARRRTPAALASGLTLELGDGRSLPHPDGSFDIAHASLVLHHLSPDAAVEMLREMRRVARLGVIVNDLDRSRLGWLGALLLGHLLTRNRYTRNDAPLSVRRAYRLGEAWDLVRAAGLTPIWSARGFLGHRYSIAAVPGGAGE